MGKKKRKAASASKSAESGSQQQGLLKGEPSGESSTALAEPSQEPEAGQSSSTSTATPPTAPAPQPSDDCIKWKDKQNGWYYVQYDPAREDDYLPAMRQLISKDLSEPYSIYVYRYFLHGWPDLCFMCLSPSNHLLGVIINKLEPHVAPSRQNLPIDETNPPKNRGYIAMIATHASHRKKGIGKELVQLGVEAMAEQGADVIALETEVDNVASLKLYAGLGFLRSKRLHRYYLNGNEAFRLILNVEKDPKEEPKVSEPIVKEWNRRQQRLLLKNIVRGEPWEWKIDKPEIGRKWPRGMKRFF